MSKVNVYVLMLAFGALLSMTVLLFFDGEDVSWVLRYGLHAVSLLIAGFAAFKLVNS